MSTWKPLPLELNETERRATHFAIARRIASAREKDDKNPPKRLLEKQVHSALRDIETSFNATLENTLGRDERKEFDVTDGGISAAVEALSFAVKTIEGYDSIRGFIPFLTAVGLDACKNARARCVQSVPVHLHDDLGLEVIEGAVFFKVGKDE